MKNWKKNIFKYFETSVVLLNLLFIATFFFGVDLTVLMSPLLKSDSFSTFFFMAAALSFATVITILPLTIVYLLTVLVIKLKTKENKLKVLFNKFEGSFENKKELFTAVIKIQSVFMLLFFIITALCFIFPSSAVFD